MVGGFGSSQYLKDRVEKSQPEIQVLQPSDAWSAIVKYRRPTFFRRHTTLITFCRGAALSKLPQAALVESTKATKHYGVTSWSIYDENLDKGEITEVRRDGRVRAETFTWYIGIADDLRRDQVIKFPFYRSLDADYTSEDLLFEDKLYESKDKIAPRHKSKADALKVNCSVNSDLREVDRSKFRKMKDRNGEP